LQEKKPGAKFGLTDQYKKLPNIARVPPLGPWTQWLIAGGHFLLLSGRVSIGAKGKGIKMGLEGVDIGRVVLPEPV
jgi:hypothetical protein